MFRVHSVSQRPNLRHLGEPLGGAKSAKSLLEAVSFKKAIFILYLYVVRFYIKTRF